jgi:hypothetical protein
MGLEGIVSKRLGSRYRSGRSKDWLKFKNPEAPAVKREADEKWGLDPSGGASMANDEHVAMLKKGVRAWNEWRDENPNVVTWRSEDTNVPYYPGLMLHLPPPLLSSCAPPNKIFAPGLQDVGVVESILGGEVENPTKLTTGAQEADVAATEFAAACAQTLSNPHQFRATALASDRRIFVPNNSPPLLRGRRAPSVPKRWILPQSPNCCHECVAVVNE